MSVMRLLTDYVMTLVQGECITGSPAGQELLVSEGKPESLGDLVIELIEPCQESARGAPERVI
jgi:hypothetical protein